MQQAELAAAPLRRRSRKQVSFQQLPEAHLNRGERSVSCWWKDSTGLKLLHSITPFAPTCCAKQMFQRYCSTLVIALRTRLFVCSPQLIEHTVPGAGHNRPHYADAACSVCLLQAIKSCHVAWR